MSENEENQAPGATALGAQSIGPLVDHQSSATISPSNTNKNNTIQTSVSFDGTRANLARANGAQFARVDANEPLLDGFILLRLAQLLNIDVYYIGLLKHQPPARAQSLPRHSTSLVSESRQCLVESGGGGKWAADSEAASSSGSKPRQADTGESTEQLPMLSIQPYPKMVSCQINSDGNGSPRGGDQAQDLQAPQDRKNLLDELAEICPIHHYIERNQLAAGLLRVMRISLSLIAIMISVDKTISTILLCLISRPDIKVRPGNIGLAYETSDVSMSWLVLILLNISSMYILLSTVFNGHLLWQLLSQRLFLVSRTFQYKTMLSMFVFIYLEYIINISFTSNLFGWSFETNDNDVASDGPGGARWHKGGAGNSAGANIHGNIVNSYSVLSNIKTFVTEKDDANLLLDVLLTIFQFARGIIRIGPYITINYVTICLNEHIKTIRNQTLLTESLKRKQKLKMVVKSKRTKMIGRRRQQQQPIGGRNNSPSIGGAGSGFTSPSYNQPQVEGGAARKKRVIFVTEASGSEQDNTSLRPPPLSPASMMLGNNNSGSSMGLSAANSRTPSPMSAISAMSSGATSLASLDPSLAGQSADGVSSPAGASMMAAIMSGGDSQRSSSSSSRRVYLERIKDFNELEAYITNLYIFTGRLNRLMSRQGLALFFIVHNLVITTTLIVPEAISGGQLMVHLVRVLVVLIGIVPFIAGQALDGQLEQLSKQIDRIIIKQQFISRKRDNLVRIRELLHDIRVNCGGMLDFNIETGIKYLVVAFATAFFIEQEDYKLTRRH